MTMRKKALGFIAGLLGTTVALAQLPHFVFTVGDSLTSEYSMSKGLLVDNNGNVGILFQHIPPGSSNQFVSVVKLDLNTMQVLDADTLDNLPIHVTVDLEQVGNTFWGVQNYPIPGFGGNNDLSIYNVNISGTQNSSSLHKWYDLTDGGSNSYYVSWMSNYPTRLAYNKDNGYVLLVASVDDVASDNYAYLAALDTFGNIISDTLIKLSAGNLMFPLSIYDLVWTGGDTFLLLGEIMMFGSYANHFIKRIVFNSGTQAFVDADFTANVFNRRSNTTDIYFRKAVEGPIPGQYFIFADSLGYPLIFSLNVGNIPPLLTGLDFDLRDQNNNRIPVFSGGGYHAVFNNSKSTYFVAFMTQGGNIGVVAVDVNNQTLKWGYGYKANSSGFSWLRDIKLMGDKLVIYTDRLDTLTNPANQEALLFTIDTTDGSVLKCQDHIIVLDTFTGSFVPFTLSHVNPDYNSVGMSINVPIQDNGSATMGQHPFVLQDRSYSIDFTLSKTDPSNCSASDGSITFSASGGISPYTYYDTANNMITSPLSNLPAGTYTIVAVDANGCRADTFITLAPANQPSVSNATITNASCPGSSDGSVNITVQNCGACQFTWIDNNTGDTVGNSQNLSNVPAGDYVVIIVDGNCSVTSGPYTVNEPAPITITGSVTNVSTCGASDGSINISVSGGTPGYSYSWTGPGGFTSSNQNISNLSPGSYIVTVTDANGCTAQDTFVVGTPTPPSIDTTQTTVTDVSCNGGSDGAINITVQNCVNCQYSWTGPGGYSANTEDISGLAAGQYIITITDGNTSCSYTDTFIVSEPPAITINGTVTDVSCNGGSDGSIDITVGGGVGNFTFSWSNGSTTEDLTGVAAGSYTVTVTDGNGCTATASFTVNEPPALTISLSFDSNTNVISASVSGGTPPYSYSWNTGSTDDSIVVSTSGQYFVTVTDANGCSISDTITVQVTSGIVSIESAGCKLFNESERVRLTCSRTPATATLYDLLGRQMPLKIQGNEIIIDKPKGIYTLRVIWINGDVSIVELLGR